MYSNPVLIRLRSALRSLGILRFIEVSQLYGLISKGYESRFDAAMMAILKPGMRVYDIGANVGYYTRKFAEAVGPDGEVHAFEPMPASAAKVRELQAQYPWIHVHQYAVADAPGEALMDAEANSSLPTSQILIEAKNGVVKTERDQGVTVPVTTLDQAVEKWGVPAVIKIDVEGYELHVLRGALEVLSSTSLKHVYIEIHFNLLEARGLPMAAEDIARLLSDSHFTYHFNDFSHLQASRP